LDRDTVFRLIFEHAEVGIYQSSPAGYFVLVNHALARLFGFASREEMCAYAHGRIASFYVDADLRQRLLDELYKTGKISSYISEVRCLSGKTRWISESAILVKDGQNAEYVLGTVVDVTDVITSQQALATAEERYRSIFDNAIEGIYISTLDGRLLNANKAFAQFNGYDKPEELLSKIGDLNDWYADPERRKQFIELVNHDGYAVNFESEVFRHKTREKIWVTENARLICDPDGKPTHYEGTIQDITERKNFERQLLLTQRAAETSNRAKSEFLANMSHELRTPLNAIMGFSELITLSTQGDLKTAKIHEYAHDILLSARILYQLISEILDFSKIDSGTAQLEEKPIDLRNICKQAALMIEERARRGSISVRLKTDDEAPSIRGDERRLLQVLLNLVTNAVKFTLPGGEVTIATGWSDEGSPVITVADTGIGISEKDLSRVFEPFVQINRSVFHQQEGTGLGLAICKSLVEQHGGRVEISSRQGMGTTVSVILPAERVIRPNDAMPIA